MHVSAEEFDARRWPRSEQQRRVAVRLMHHVQPGIREAREALARLRVFIKPRIRGDVAHNFARQHPDRALDAGLPGAHRPDSGTEYFTVKHRK